VAYTRVPGNVTAITIRGAHLPPGEPLFLSIRATNGAGLASVFHDTAPVLHDPSGAWLPPVLDGLSYSDVAGAVRELAGGFAAQVRGVNTAAATDTSAVPANATLSIAAVRDRNLQGDATALAAGLLVPDSGPAGIAAVHWCVGTLQGSCDIREPAALTWDGQAYADAAALALAAGTADLDVSTMLPLPYQTASVPLPDNQRLYTTVWAVSGNGMVASAASNGVTVDAGPPAAGAVWDGPETGQYTADVDCQSVGSPLSASWHGFSARHGLDHYLWGVGTQPGAADVLPFASVGLATAASSPTPALKPGQLLFSTVIAVDMAGRAVTASSDGVRLVCGSASQQSSDPAVRAACASAMAALDPTATDVLCSFELQRTGLAEARVDAVASITASFGRTM
jgi:hypothetical protein